MTTWLSDRMAGFATRLRSESPDQTADAAPRPPARNQGAAGRRQAGPTLR
jgi:hypothetical protein